MKVEWLYDESPDFGRWRTLVQLWPEKGSKMVFAPLDPFDKALLEYFAGTVRMIRRGLWEAFDETGRSCGTDESGLRAADLLPRVWLSKAHLRRTTGRSSPYDEILMVSIAAGINLK